MTLIATFNGIETKTYTVDSQDEIELLKLGRKLLNKPLGDIKRLEYKEGFAYYKVSESKTAAFEYYLEIDLMDVCN